MSTGSPAPLDAATPAQPSRSTPTAPPSKRPSGRRPGDSGTRDAILTAAREQFAAKGYESASLRTIAGAAGVDTALIRYFFGSKDDLFAAALAIPAAVVSRMTDAMRGPVESLGERVADTYLGLWEDPETATPLLSMVRSAVATGHAADLLREFMAARVLSVVAPLEVDRPRLRATLTGSHLLGVAIARHALRIPPISELPRGELVAIVGPTLQHYLTGDLASA
jgi:AcrR family transcriptional regulator